MKIYYGEPKGFGTFFSVVLAVVSAFIPEAYTALSRSPTFKGYGLVLDGLFILAAVLLICVLVAVSNNGLYRFRWFRRLVKDPMTGFEGFWIQYTGIKGRPYSFATFEYYYDEHRYRYFGHALDHRENAKVQGRWEASIVLFDVEQNRIIFFSEHAEERGGGTREEVYNFGWLHPVTPDNLDQLEGEVRDFRRHIARGQPLALRFEISFMRKLSRKEIRTVLKRPTPKTIEDEHQLVLAFLPAAKLKEGEALSSRQ